MKTPRYFVDSDIRNASTLPGSFYTDQAVYSEVLEKIFVRSWQCIGDEDLVRVPGQVHPVTFLEGSLNEPLLLTRDRDDVIHCVSNVCTHRGNILVESAGHEKTLRCRYHGRRFGLDGCFQSMPECEQAQNFPTADDNLKKIAHAAYEQFLFASLDPAYPFEDLIRPMQERIGWMPLHEFRFDPQRSREYLVETNWALYCDNYLEGFHIPYIHAGLNAALDYANYRTELFSYASLQLGMARSGESAFELPATSPDYGSQIAAYYFWLFPNMMFNFYPWGLSINLVKPLGIKRTKIVYRTWVWREELLETGAGANLDRVEREDHAVVEAVLRGVRSRFYRRGRFSPTQEQGPHHFHRLVSRILDSAAEIR